MVNAGLTAESSAKGGAVTPPEKEDLQALAEETVKNLVKQKKILDTTPALPDDKEQMFM